MFSFSIPFSNRHAKIDVDPSDSHYLGNAHLNICIEDVRKDITDPGTIFALELAGGSWESDPLFFSL